MVDHPIFSLCFRACHLHLFKITMLILLPKYAIDFLCLKIISFLAQWVVRVIACVVMENLWVCIIPVIIEDICFKLWQVVNYQMRNPYSMEDNYQKFST